MSSPHPKARVISLSKVLEDAVVTAGETATFQCELSFEGIAVEWFLGGTKLESSNRVSYFTSLNSAHMLTKGQRNHSLLLLLLLTIPSFFRASV